VCQTLLPVVIDGPKPCLFAVDQKAFAPGAPAPWHRTRRPRRRARAR
jgi:hypothetical protein